MEKSPEKTGVNRRNAVLFTRKKEAAKSEEKPILKSSEGKEEEDEMGKKVEDDQKQGGEFEFHEPEFDSPSVAELPSQLKKRGRKPKRGDERQGRSVPAFRNQIIKPCKILIPKLVLFPEDPSMTALST